MEDNDVVALAETEKEPEDYIAQQKFTMNKVQAGFNIPLEFFDNPEVDLQHPSIELIMWQAWGPCKIKVLHHKIKVIHMGTLFDCGLHTRH